MQKSSTIIHFFQKSLIILLTRIFGSHDWNEIFTTDIKRSTKRECGKYMKQKEQIK
jgi:hypothetical protein